MGHADYIWNVCVYTERLVWTELSVFIFGHSEGGVTDRGEKGRNNFYNFGLLWLWTNCSLVAHLFPSTPPPAWLLLFFFLFFLFEFLQCDENCCQQKEKAKAKADPHVAHQPYLAWHLIFTISIWCFSQRCAKKNSKKQTLRNVKIAGAGG